VKGQNFFENDGIKCLYRYTRILIITSRRVFYEFIMGNKHKVLGFNTKLWRSQPPEVIGGLGAKPPVYDDSCSFLINISHFDAYLRLNFYKNLFLSL